MGLPDSTWRDHPFKKGEIYTARESYSGFGASKFVAGHDYVFDGVMHSHYDSSTIFTFHELGKVGAVDWWWHDEEADALCHQYFKVSGEVRP
jgi:hypothetical protein